MYPGFNKGNAVVAVEEQKALLTLTKMVGEE